ncbi:unnamed protein product [Calypogeia fissa]
MDGGNNDSYFGEFIMEEEDDDPEPEPVERNRTKSTIIPEDLGDRRNHPALERAQAALKQQLLAKKQELEDRTYEQGAFLKRATKRREDAGVALYGMQKALASLHLAIHKDIEELAEATEKHNKAKEELAETQSSHAQQSKEVRALRERLEQTNLELDDLLNTLKQVEKYNEEIKSEIAVNRRLTYASEELMVQKEKAKKEEDLQITLMQTRMKHQYEKQALLRAQLAVQERETKLANVALQEAGTEMESISAEKKQVTIQWKSSLLVLSRCDEALQGIIDSIANQKEQEIAVMVEKESYKKAIRKEQEKEEKQQMLLRKVDREMKAVQKLLGTTTAKRLAILEAWRKLVKQVEKIEATQANLKVDIAHLERVLKVHEREFARETEGIYDLEHKILQDIVEHCITEEKAAANTLHMIVAKRQLAKREDMRATEIEFDLARIRVDVLSVQAYNENVKLALKVVNDEVEEKLVEIGKVQQEIKRKHVEVEMKTKEIDKLNKAYFKLVSNMYVGDQTPWDHIMTNIKYEINRRVVSSSEKQKEWLLMQTALINLISQTNDLSEKYQRMCSEKVVLMHRRCKVEGQFDAITKFLKDLDKRVKEKQGVILRLNDMIAKNATLEDLLKQENVNLQSANYVALKELGRDLVSLEEQLGQAKNERTYAVKHFDELEHHVMLWKYKITFELKTQAAIDPNVGRVVITALKKQCDRLKLMHNNLAFFRDKLCQSLENQVANRKVIDTKVKAMSMRKGFDGPASIEANLFKVCAELKKSTRDIDKSYAAIEERLDILEESKKNLESKVECMDNAIQEIVKEQEGLRILLRDKSHLKTTELMATTLQQRMCRRCEDVKSNKWKVQVKGPIVEELSESQKKCQTLARVVQILIHQLPHMQPKLDMMVVQLSLATKSSIRL